MNYAGIDVSYKEIVIVISVKGKARKAKTYKNPYYFIHAFRKLLSSHSLLRTSKV